MGMTLTVLKYSPAVNPDRVFLKAAITGAYTQVTGEPLNLTPSKWLDPSCLGVIGPSATAPLAITPDPFSQNLGGYYAQVLKGTTLSNYAVRFFGSQGAELAAGAYPPAITGGELVFEVEF